MTLKSKTVQFLLRNVKETETSLKSAIDEQGLKI